MRSRNTVFTKLAKLEIEIAKNRLIDAANPAPMLANQERFQLTMLHLALANKRLDRAIDLLQCDFEHLTRT